MKRSELEKIIKDLGLECQVGNSLYTIMQVWQPHKNSGFNIDGKYYSAEVLPASAVDRLNDSFAKLLDVLEKNNIQIRTVSEVENGVISEWDLDIRKEPLSNKEQDLDFEIETDIPKKPYGIVEYSHAMPEETGYGAGAYEFDVSRMFRDFKLKPHERQMVIDYIDDIFDRFISADNLDWIMNFIREQNDITPLQIAIEKSIFTPTEAIEYVFGNDEIYYDKEKEYTAMFKYLTTLPATDLNINKDTSYRGSLPEIIVTNKTLYKNVLKNWEFEYDSGQRLLTFLIQDEYNNQFVEFIKTKDPKNYYFDDWYDLQEYVLKTIGDYDAKFIQKLFDDKWMEVEHIDMDYIVDFVYEQINSLMPETNVVLIKEVLKHKSLEDMDRLLGKVLESIAFENGISETDEAKKLVQPFIDNYSKLDFKQADAEIMKYLDESHPLRLFLLTQEDFINYLVEINKLEYLPTVAKDIFLF